MALYRITHTCGHTVDHNLTGPTSSRDWQVNKMQNEDCKDCKLAAANQKAAATNQASGLPALEGSEKQVAWAESLRAKRIKQLAELEADLATAKERGFERRVALFEPQVKKIKTLLESNQAKAFIDANNQWEF